MKNKARLKLKPRMQQSYAVSAVHRETKNQNMSFGYSIGDFITLESLIQNIVSSLRAFSISEYRELML